MTDTQYNPLGTVSAPASWTLPASLQVKLKQVYASFNGASSVASWQPCLTIISDSGHTVAEYVSDTTVAAGGSADVTWFPRLGGGGTQTISWQPVRAWGFNTSGQSVAAGTTANSSFTTVRTSDSTQLSWSTTTVTNDTLTLHGVGWALLWASASWPTGTNIDYRIDSPNGFEVFAHDGFKGMTGFGSDLTLGLATIMDACWIDTTSASTTPLRVKMTNSDAGANGPDTAWIGCIFFPGLSL